MEWLVIFSVMMCRDGEIKFDQAHYDLLVMCAEKGDLTEWNEWYKDGLVYFVKSLQMTVCKYFNVVY